MFKKSEQLAIIVLSGGLGTRIRDSIGEIPKILAPINDKLFIDFFLDWLSPVSSLENTNLIFSLFYKSSLVINYLRDNYRDFNFNVDQKAYGTFGAVCNAAINFPSEYYLILNGDTIFMHDLLISYKKFLKEPSIPLIILKKSSNNNRYGGYRMSQNKWVFSEKNCNAISMGAYFISYEELVRRWRICTNKELSLSNLEFFLERKLMNDNDCLSLQPVNAVVLDEETPFIDIGVKTSYLEAQKLIPTII